MAGSDGSVVLEVDMNVSEADKKLGKLKSRISNLEDDINEKEFKKNVLVEQAEVLNAKIKEATIAVEKYSAEWKSNPTEATQAAWDKSLEAVKELNKQYDEVVKKIDKMDSALSDDNISLDYMKQAAGDLESKIQSATRAAKELAEREKRAADYIAQVAERQESILGKIKSELSYVAGNLKEAFQTVLSGALGKTLNLIKSIPGAMKSAFFAISSVFVKAATGVGKFLYRLNVFPKLLDNIKEKTKRLFSTAKSALIYSAIYQGLGYVRKQIGAYLLVNKDFVSAIGSLKGAFLTAFQPIYSAVIPALTSLLNTITRVTTAIAHFISALFGTTAKQAQKNASALYKQASATKAAGKAAEDASGSIASFDEINALSTDSKGGGGADSSEIAPAFDAETGQTVFSSWGEAFSRFLDNILNKGIPELKKSFSGFSDWLNNLSRNVYEMFTFPGVLEKVERLGKELATALNGLVVSINWDILGRAIGAGLNTAIAFGVALIYNFDWKNLGASIATSLNGMVSQIDWYALGKLMFFGWKIAIDFLAGLLLTLDMAKLAEAASKFAIGFFDTMSETIQNIDWEKIGQQIKELLVNVDWGGISEAVFTALRSAFGAAAQFLRGFIHDAWQTIVEWWRDVAYEDGTFVLQGLLDGIAEVAKNILSWLDEHVVTPLLDGFKQLFGIHSPSTVMAELGNYIMAGLLNGITNGWNSIKAWFATYIAPKLKVQYWADKFSGIKDGFTQSIKNGINSAIELVNKFISWINNKLVLKIPQLTIGGKTIFEGKSFQAIKIPPIPYLAQGAVIPPNREFMAVLGDQKSGNNIEAPEDLIRKIVREESGGGNAELLQAILEAIRDGHIIMVDSAVFGRTAIKSINDANKRAGKQLLLI